MSGDQVVGREVALLAQDARDGPDDRLGHRHQQVCRVGSHAAAVLLGDERSVVQHQPGIGGRGVEHISQRDVAAAASRNRQPGDVRRRAGEVLDGTRIARHAMRREELLDVLERPAMSVLIQPVGRNGGRVAPWSRDADLTGSSTTFRRSRQGRARSCDARRSRTTNSAEFPSSGECLCCVWPYPWSYPAHGWHTRPRQRNTTLGGPWRSSGTIRTTRPSTTSRRRACPRTPWG